MVLLVYVTVVLQNTVSDLKTVCGPSLSCLDCSVLSDNLPTHPTLPFNVLDFIEKINVKISERFIGPCKMLPLWIFKV